MPDGPALRPGRAGGTLTDCCFPLETTMALTLANPLRAALLAAVLANGVPALAADFTLKSPQIAPGAKLAEAQVYNGFGCSGGNISPELRWSGAPAGTKSFALLVHDPDAPTGSGWWHWVVWNIPATASGLPAKAGDPAARLMPAGTVQGNTDFGAPGYGGPCPPPGAKPHRYFFRLHALKVDRLDLPANATAAFVGFNVNANTLGVAELMGTFNR
jgi:Raf kinase inhibitor-like YbhB/YbcL family protein